MTTIALDTFTGTDGTDIAAHTPDLGPLWVYDLDWGVHDPGFMLIEGGRLRRLLYAESSYLSNGEGMIKWASTPAQQSTYEIHASITVNEVGNSFFAVYAQMYYPDYEATYDTLLFQFGAASHLHYLNASNKVTVNSYPASVVGQTYAVKLAVNGIEASYFIDGVLMQTGVFDAHPDFPLSIVLFEQGTARLRVDSFTVLAPDPPQAFWRDLVLSVQEVA